MPCDLISAESSIPSNNASVSLTALVVFAGAGLPDPTSGLSEKASHSDSEEGSFFASVVVILESATPISSIVVSDSSFGLPTEVSGLSRSIWSLPVGGVVIMSSSASRDCSEFGPGRATVSTDSVSGTAPATSNSESDFGASVSATISIAGVGTFHPDNFPGCA